jgi:hypothetical protein
MDNVLERIDEDEEQKSEELDSGEMMDRPEGIDGSLDHMADEPDTQYNN